MQTQKIRAKTSSASPEDMAAIRKTDFLVQIFLRSSSSSRKDALGRCSTHFMEESSGRMPQLVFKPEFSLPKIQYIYSLQPLKYGLWLGTDCAVSSEPANSDENHW